MTPRPLNTLTQVGKIQKVVSDAIQDLKHLNDLQDQDSKAQAAALCKTKLLQAAVALEQLARQHRLPVPDSFWTTGPSNVPSNEPAAALPLDKERMKMKFVAQYSDECPAGDGDVQGERVVKTNHDRIWHEQCWALEGSK